MDVQLTRIACDRLSLSPDDCAFLWDRVEDLNFWSRWD